MRFEAELPFTFEADNVEQAEERLWEIWSALDWTLVPEEYNVDIEDGRILRAVP